VINIKRNTGEKATVTSGNPYNSMTYRIQGGEVFTIVRHG
jgi:hypothetical protein